MKHVEAAQLRANISSFLFNNPGKHGTEKVASHFGISNRTAGQILLHMAKSGLIAPMEKQGTKKLWSWPEGKEAVPAGEPVVLKSQKSGKPAHAPKEVELVVGGILVIIGKNEKTGRLRITLEDA